MAPCLVEYRGASVSGSKEASSQHMQHSTTLCQTPAQMICMSSAVTGSGSQQMLIVPTWYTIALVSERSMRRHM